MSASGRVSVATRLIVVVAVAATILQGTTLPGVRAQSAEPDACMAQKPVNVTGVADGCTFVASGWSVNYVSQFMGGWTISGPGLHFTGRGPAVGSRPVRQGVAYTVTLGEGVGTFVIASKPSGAVPAPASSSPFTWRGIVQGFYGTPWTHDVRLDQIRWMSRHGMNMYLHAPKDDPYQRYSWREPYPASQLDELRGEIEVARHLGVTWVPNISPGIPLTPPAPSTSSAPSRDVCFSCPEDLEAIYSKLDPFFDAGARVLMVSLDDVQKVSSHPEDAPSLGADSDEHYGRMNRELLNAVFRRYRDRAAPASFTLLTVLADYSGTTDTPYLEGIRSEGGLEDGIEVFWTGTEVFSNEIHHEAAATYAALVGRTKVLIWDNYPVNDNPHVPQSHRLYLGPYEGRAPDLGRSVSGILANPMREPYSSRIARGP